MNDKLFNKNIAFLLYCVITLINYITLSLLSLVNYPECVINNIVISSFRYAQILSVISVVFFVLIAVKIIKCTFTKFEKYVFGIFVIIQILICLFYMYALLNR